MCVGFSVFLGIGGMGRVLVCVCVYVNVGVGGMGRVFVCVCSCFSKVEWDG